MAGSLIIIYDLQPKQINSNTN